MQNKLVILKQINNIQIVLVIKTIFISAHDVSLLIILIHSYPVYQKSQKISLIIYSNFENLQQNKFLVLDLIFIP